MKTVALTGGIGSGKTVVSSLLTKRGIPVYNSDAAVKKLYNENDDLLDSIEEAFGCSVRSADGTFDKSKLASIVFTSASRLRTLEDIVHPVVLKDFRRWTLMQDTRFGDDGPTEKFFGHQPFCVIESAIILSKPDFMACVDKVVMVDASASVRLARACARDGADATAILQRMAAQHFDIGKVDAFIRNDSTVEELEEAVIRTFSSLDL